APPAAGEGAMPPHSGTVRLTFLLPNFAVNRIASKLPSPSRSRNVATIAVYAGFWHGDAIVRTVNPSADRTRSSRFAFGPRPRGPSTTSVGRGPSSSGGGGGWGRGGGG